MQGAWVWSLVGELGDFPGDSDGKESACNAGDLGWIPGLEDPLEKEMATHSSILAYNSCKIPHAMWHAK